MELIQSSILFAQITTIVMNLERRNMHQLYLIAQIIIGWIIILWILDWMIQDGLLDEIRHFIKERIRDK